MSVDLSREFKLVAACCLWPPSPSCDANIRVCAASPINWTRVARIARRQRVQALVHAGLRRTAVVRPTQVPQALADEARGIALQGLFQAAESGRLQTLLDNAAIPNLVLKGVALEMLAYGELGRKAAWDIDLLVAPNQAQAARTVLKEAGYDPVQPKNLSEEQFATWVDLTKECELAHRETGLSVELHWRLADGPRLLAGMGVASPSQWVGVTDKIHLRTFAPDELFSYLSVHGAMHGWSRLKWLADLAALLANQTPDAIERLYRRSRELGAGLCSAQALLLCNRLLGLAIPPALASELRARPIVRWLEQFALDTMAGGHDEREIEDRPFAASRILLSQLALGGTWRHAFADFSFRSVSVHDRVHMPLPVPLAFLYPILRAPLWLHRRLTPRSSS